MMEQMKPMDIEKRSFAIITELLGDRRLDPENELVIKRVIHTTADFDYVDNLAFSDHAVEKGIVYGTGAWHKGAIQHTPAMQQAYDLGRDV